MESNGLHRVVAPISRVLLSLIFLVSGFTKIPQWSSMASVIAGKGLPASRVLLACAVLIEVLGGALLLTGNRARFAAGVLFVYLVPVTLVFHDFWSYSGPEHQMQLVNFLKNLSIMGGMLHVVAFGAGAYSVDHLRETYSPEERIDTSPRLRRVS